MTAAPAGQTKAPDESPAYVPDAVSDDANAAAESDAAANEPAANASKAEVRKWARDAGYSDEGTISEIRERVLAGPTDAAADAPATPAPVVPGQSETLDSTIAATAGEPEHTETGAVDLSQIPLEKLPIASQVGDLLLRVEQNKAGIVVLSVSMFGYLGETPVVTRAEYAGDLEKALDDLRTQAKNLSS